MRLEAGENTSITTTENKFSSASIGASFTPQGLSNISVNASKANRNSKESVTAYSPTLVSAENNLSLTSGKDMDIIGSRAQGDKITAKIGGNLNIETLQEKENFTEENKSAGFGGSWSMNPVTQRLSKPTFSRDLSKGTIDSLYRSARDQAGFFAGSKGFDIYARENTDLKGGIIASNAPSDKNHLSTGTFSFSDLKNEAEYTAKDTGSSAQIKPTLVQIKEKNPDGSKNKTLKVVQALHPTPSIPTVVQGSANSTTKSAVAPGTIDIRENPTQDISALSRDTANALNELGRIFDKKSVEEQKELVNVFREEAFRLLHDLPDDGSGRKVLLHSIVGGLISQFAGAGFASGAAGAGLNEALINNLKRLDPAIAQIVSGLLGAAAAKAINGNATAGAISAASGTKYNLNLKEAYSYIDQVMSTIQDHKTEIEEAVLNEAQYLIDSGNVVLGDMPGDYVNSVVSLGQFIKFTNIACTIDKFGNVYATVGFSPGVLAGPPVNVGSGRLLFKDKISSAEEYRGYIKGLSGSITAVGGIGGSLGLSSSGIIGEVQAGSNVQLGATLAYTWHIGKVG